MGSDMIVCKFRCRSYHKLCWKLYWW